MANQKMDAAEKARLQKTDDGTVVRPDQDLAGNQALRGRVMSTAAQGHFSDATRAHVGRMADGKNQPTKKSGS